MKKLTLATLLIAAAACSSKQGGTVPTDEQLAEFQLPDVNPTSGSFGLDVSPRAYLGGVSAWYFGSAT